MQPFDLVQARVHARIWAELVSCGQMIEPHDMLIASAGVALGHEVATLNVQEFQRVTGLKVSQGGQCNAVLPLLIFNKNIFGGFPLPVL